ncbi:MAG: toll/interleukin-1 receptor domain-containing protein [Treponema sp.]|nr:toll/interleukin-1 receptor domain-containing protein [Treponema sp.]
METYDVFISYSHKSDEIAKKIQSNLVKNRFRVFIDSATDYGISIPSEIRKGLKSSRHIVCLMTDDWIKSAYCQLELDTGIMNDPAAKQRKIIPLLLQKGIEIPEDLKRIKYLDFTEWTTNFKKLITELKRAITP